MIDIRPYIKLDSNLIDAYLDRVNEMLPPGWQPQEWCEWIDELSKVLSGLTVIRVHIDKGLLRFSGHSNNPIHNGIFNCVAQQIARESSMVCMICGQRGHRRKLEEGWPCLCESHYIEYINFLDEQIDNGKRAN